MTLPHEPPSDASRPPASPGRERSRGLALWANAAAIALLAFALLMGGDGRDEPALPEWPSLMPAAYGQLPPAGGAGLYLMPAQLARDIWGVYVMDVDRQSLMVYQFDASGKKLNFLAARELQNDRLLGDYNTFPNPLEIKAIADKERQTRRLEDETEPGQP